MDTDIIIITFPEVKVEIPIKDLTFDTLMKLIFDIIQAIARKAFSKVLSDIDRYLRKNCRQRQLENTGKRSKTFLTRLVMSNSAVSVTLIKPAKPIISWMRPYIP